MSQMKQSKKIIIQIVSLALSAGLLGFAFLGFHDAQIAQGAGLYISMQFHADNRMKFDILMDCIGIISILLTSLLPPILLKKLSPASYLRFICLFLAFIPMINPGTLVHILSHFRDWTVRPLWISYSLLQGLEATSSLLWIEIPLLILLLAINKKDKKRTFAYTKVLLILSLISCLLFLFFPGFAEYTLFFSHYFLLILIFDESELLLEKNTKPQWPILSFYILCALKGIYRIIVLLQTAHI